MSKLKKVNCIIDADPGVDDTVAIALSLYDEVLDIKLITTVNGNLSLDTVTRNTLHVLEKFNRTDIPVVKGASKAMERVSPDASFIHQKEGMGGYIPPVKVKTQAVDEDAVEAMYRTIVENKNNINIFVLGPHTNLGHLFTRHPDAAQMISGIYCEGCAAYGNKIETGKWKTYVSFNASSDPEAMKIVFNSGAPITIVPSRMGRELANFTEEQVNEFQHMNDVGNFIYEMYSQYWEHGYEDRRIATNDTCALMAARFPKLFKTKQAFFDINTTDAPGKTVVTFNKKGNVKYVYKVNRKKLHKLFNEAILKLDHLKF